MKKEVMEIDRDIKGNFSMGYRCCGACVGPSVLNARTLRVKGLHVAK